MSLGRAVPWTSWAEWRQVGHWLLSETPEEVQQGLDSVMAWRVRGRVPLGVDSTACFVEARQRDRGGGAASESELRLQYGLAVVRMVNGIADSSQRGRVAASVASLAASAGLPRILVDLRHEATHNELPSLAALRLAAQHGLAWLQANYWRRQWEHVQACLGRLTDLAREYLLLHQAAAAKVAASAALGPDGDSEAEEGPDAGLSAAAAAVAAATTLSAGRRSSGRPAAGGAAPAAAAAAAADGAASPAGGYDAADAKKRRRLLLAELRSAVPRPAAALLADALLAATARLEAAVAEASKGARGRGEQGSASSPAAVERALAAAMGHLTAIWPQLPPLLLRGAVQALVSAAEGAEGGQEGTEQDPSGSRDAETLGSAVAWLRRLLPQQSGSSSVLAACGRWRPDAALLRQLLAAALPAFAAAEREAAVQALRQAADGTCRPAAAPPGPAVAALQEAAALLQAAARSTPGAAAAAAAAISVFSAGAPASAAGPASGADDAASSARLAAAAESQAALLQRVQQRTASQPAAPCGGKRPAAGDQPEGVKRWRRVAGWQPCALGCLPCAADPNGRQPVLQEDPPLALPPAFLREQAASAAAAAAARESAGQAGSTAGCGRQEALLREERAGLAAAAAADIGGAWPAADLFAEATAGRGVHSEEAGSHQPAEHPFAVRISLPAACTPLL